MPQTPAGQWNQESLRPHEDTVKKRCDWWGKSGKDEEMFGFFGFGKFLASLPTFQTISVQANTQTQFDFSLGLRKPSKNQQMAMAQKKANPKGFLKGKLKTGGFLMVFRGHFLEPNPGRNGVWRSRCRREMSW